MRMPTLLVLVAISACLTAFADEEPEATSAACPFALSATGSPFALKTAADIAALPQVTYQPVETVTLTAPDGTVSALVSGASGAGTAALPITAAGGVWTARSSRSGTATFTVRRSLDGTLGAGTAASPAVIVDADELIDYNAGAGYVFVADAWDGLLNALVLPSGFRLEDLGDGAWGLASSADGCQYDWAGNATFSVDSRATGPNRTTTRREALPVAYTGDNWIGNDSKAATLTIAPPTGEPTTLNIAGTGAQPFDFCQPGNWTLLLAMADGSALESVVSVIGEAFTLIVR